MTRPLLPFAAILLFSSVSAQDDAIYNSVGTFLGNRSEIVGECIKEVKKDKEMEMFDANMVCECMVGTLLTMEEVDKATSEAVFEELDFEAAMASDTALMASFQQCVVASMQGDVPIRR